MWTSFLGLYKKPILRQIGLLLALGAFCLRCWANPIFLELTSKDAKSLESQYLLLLAGLANGYDCTGAPLVFGVVQPPDGNTWYTVTYGANRFVALSPDGANRGMISQDGLAWSPVSVPLSFWTRVNYLSNQFVAVGNGSTPDAMTSTDGINWSPGVTSSGTSEWLGVTYGDGLFLAVGNILGDRVISSMDGVNWTVLSAPVAGGESAWSGVTYGNGRFIAVADGGINQVLYADCARR